MSKPTSLISIDHIYFKREDENPTGSIKDRGIPLQIEDAVRDGYRNFVISSSGNAAISAAEFCVEKNVQLTVFVPDTVSSPKLKRLSLYPFQIYQSKQPLTDSLEHAKKNNAHHLRQSTDPIGIIGYMDIAHEIPSDILLSKDTALFVPVSSGTAFVGIYEGFSELLSSGKISKLPSMHIVQSQKIHPIAHEFDGAFTRKSMSIVDAIVPPLNPPRKEHVMEIINKTGGGGWVCSDSQVIEAQSWLTTHSIETSNEGALALAGFWKALHTQGHIEQPIILLTGKKYE